MEHGDDYMTEKQAARLVKRLYELGHSKEEAYETLAIVMKAELKEEEKKEASQPNKQ